jgi:hypothetical protein
MYSEAPFKFIGVAVTAQQLTSQSTRTPSDVSLPFSLLVDDLAFLHPGSGTIAHRKQLAPRNLPTSIDY